jgi:uncharacterized membrane protein
MSTREHIIFLSPTYKKRARIKSLRRVLIFADSTFNQLFPRKEIQPTPSKSVQFSKKAQMKMKEYFLSEHDLNYVLAHGEQTKPNWYIGKYHGYEIGVIVKEIGENSTLILTCWKNERR